MTTAQRPEPARRSGLLVRDAMCATCIYRPKSPLDLKKLEAEIADGHGGYRTFRACHDYRGDKVCCKGFWDRHRDAFPGGQIAQRLNAVHYIGDERT